MFDECGVGSDDFDVNFREIRSQRPYDQPHKNRLSSIHDIGKRAAIQDNKKNHRDARSTRELKIFEIVLLAHDFSFSASEISVLSISMSRWLSINAFRRLYTPYKKKGVGNVMLHRVGRIQKLKIVATIPIAMNTIHNALMNLFFHRLAMLCSYRLNARYSLIGCPRGVISIIEENNTTDLEMSNLDSSINILRHRTKAKRIPMSSRGFVIEMTCYIK